MAWTVGADRLSGDGRRTEHKRALPTHQRKPATRAADDGGSHANARIPGKSGLRR